MSALTLSGKILVDLEPSTNIVNTQNRQRLNTPWLQNTFQTQSNALPPILQHSLETKEIKWSLNCYFNYLATLRVCKALSEDQIKSLLTDG